MSAIAAQPTEPARHEPDPCRLLDSCDGALYRTHMLQWLRARAGSVAPAVLLALATLALPHIDAHHDGHTGFPAIVVHDASDHSIGRVPASNERPDHCAICHWTRTFRLQTRVAAVASLPTVHLGRSHLQQSPPASRGVATQPPLRAPPSSPAFA